MKPIVPPSTPASALSVVARSKQRPAAPTNRGPGGAHPLLLPLVVWGVLACLAGAARAQTYLDLIGGKGGTPFDGGCPPGQNLGGFELRTGAYIDAIRPVCVISLGPREFRVAPVQPPFFGGPGGGNRLLMCRNDLPIVVGIDVTAYGKEIVTVLGLELYCGAADSTQKHIRIRDASYQSSTRLQQATTSARAINQRCPPDQVAIGMHGRSGSWLDAMGLICGVPRLLGDRVARPAGTTVKTLGRAGPPLAAGSQQPICDVAKEARARNSPAAPGLEAQCLAARLANAADRVGTSAITPSSRNTALMNQGKAVTPAGALSPTTPLLSTPSPLGAGGAALNKPGSQVQIGGAALNQPVIQAPAAARSRLQKADGVALNPQPLPPDPPEALTRVPSTGR